MNIRFDNINTVGSLGENSISHLEFNKNTLIYGENGMGKSTIVSLFKGLSYGDKVEATLPKTHGGKTLLDYTVDVDGNISNQDTSKSILQNKLLVFDKDFIARNLVNEDNMILFGNAANKYNRKKNKINDKNVDMTQFEAKCTSLGIQYEESDYFFNSFKDIYFNIKTKLDNGYNPVELKEYIDKSILDYKFDLIESIPEIVEFIRGKIKIPRNVLNHVIGHTLRNNAIWQMEGLEIIKDDECPFCGKKFSKKSQKLVEGYLELKNNFDLDIYNKMFEALKKLVAFRSKVDEINSRIDYLNSKKIIKNSLSKKIKDKFTNANVLDELIMALSQKSEEPNSKKKLSIKAKNLFLGLNNINSEINEINEIIGSYDDTKLKVDIYNAIINNPTVTEECYVFSKKIVSEIEEIRKCDEFIKSESGSGICKQMNRILKMLSAPFSIEYDNGKYSIILKKIYKAFKLNKNMTEDKLSEGEKKLLAFSYFLTIAVQKDVQIIVYDDPMDCYDIPNRVHLINAINNYIKKKSNVLSILLSHDKIFLNSIAYNMDFRRIDYVYYKISERGLLSYTKTNNPMLSPILQDLVNDGVNSTNLNDQISGLMALRLFAEIENQNGVINDSKYKGLEECLTYCVHSKYVRPMSSSIPVVHQPIHLDNYSTIGSFSFDANQYKSNMNSYTGIDDVVAKQILNNLVLTANNKIKNALLLRVISEAFFMKKMMKTPRVDKAEAIINNTLMDKINIKSIFDDDIIIVASINSTLSSYMHPMVDSTYDLLDFSELEINKMVKDLQDISTRI